MGNSWDKGPKIWNEHLTEFGYQFREEIAEMTLRIKLLDSVRKMKAKVEISS